MKNNNYSSYVTASQAFDLYTVYYATLALHQLGGTDWKTWMTASVPYIISKADTDGTEKCYAAVGDSPPPMVYSRYSGTVMPTALAAMSFEMASAAYFPGSKWYTPGQHSYGYNALLGRSRRTPAADTIVLAAGSTPRTELFKLLEGQVPEIRRVGDCVEARGIREAIHEGSRVGRL